VYLNSAYFHSWALGLNIVRPSVGLNLAANNFNHYSGQELTGSSGFVLSGFSGISFQRGKIGLAANGYLPIAQNCMMDKLIFSRGLFSIDVSI